MGQYKALQRLTLGGKEYRGGDVLPADAVDPQRVGNAIYSGVVVYVPDPGEHYPGPWPGDHHSFSPEMRALVDEALARPAMPASAGKQAAVRKDVVENEDAPVAAAAPNKRPTKRAATPKT